MGGAGAITGSTMFEVVTVGRTAQYVSHAECSGVFVLMVPMAIPPKAANPHFVRTRSHFC